MKTLSLCVIAGLLAGCGVSQAAVYTVTQSGASALPGTLNWAIQSANGTDEPDTIQFAIGSGPVVVYLSGVFSIEKPVTIDGTTQPGYDGKPLISIQRPDAAATGQLYISYSAPHCIIRGLTFNGDNARYGLTVDSQDVTISNCWFGVTRDLDSLGSGQIAINCDSNVSMVSEIAITDCVFGNYHTAINLSEVTDATVRGCAIGTGPSGIAQFPIHGDGITVRDSTGVVIGGAASSDANIITNCGSSGIALLDSNDTIMRGNSIFNNLGLPIDSNMDGIVHYNDARDTDVSSGGQQNYPELSYALRDNGSIRVQGALTTSENMDFNVEIYASENVGIDGQGEPQYLLGTLNLHTDSLGLASFNEVLSDTLPSNVSVVFCATATRADGSWGTSEVSRSCYPVYANVCKEDNPGMDANWIPSGIDSGPEYPIDPASPDDVDLVREDGYLGVQVQAATTRNRVAGWRNPSLMRLPDIQNPSMFVRGKFYIYASNPMDAPLNTVPNFRIRLEDEGAVLASNTYQFANTGRTSPPYEPYYAGLNNPDLEERVGASLRPSNDPLKPSLYRVDFAPPLNAASGGTNIGATFEAMSMEDPAQGMLALTEVQLGTYYSGAILPTMVYVHSSLISSVVPVPTSSTLTESSGVFNVEADFQAGRRQQLDLPGEVPDSELATVTETATGIELDTNQVPRDRGGIAIFSVAAPDHVSAPRIEPGKLYFGIFVASSDMPVVASTPGEKVQGGFSFQLQTAGGALTTRLEYVGPASLGGPEGSAGRALLEAGLPGRNSQNWYLPDYPMPAGEDGGVYLCLMSSPLNQDIRPLSPGDLGPLADEPGPGVDAPSFRDITIGVNALQQPTSLRITADTVVPWAEPNRARIRIGGMFLAEVPEIFDGGYGY